jgi:hypothetical protein
VKKKLVAHAPWACLLLFALFEVAAHAATVARVPSPRDWQDAARFVRAQLQPGDLITSAPSWTDPLLREVLGDRIDLAMTGRSDSSAYDRVWSLSIRGAHPPELGGRTIDLTRSFGKVTVERAKLAPSNVVFDLVRALPAADVSVGVGDRERACRLGTFPPGRGGGLGLGALPTRERFECGRGLWVAQVVLEDLHLQPRYCVRQPPAPGGITRVRIPNVPLANRFVFYGGLYYEDERMRERPDVHVRVLANDHQLLAMTHHDGDGWKKLEAPTPAGNADLTIEVTSPTPDKRTLCWSATTRQ